MAEKTRVFLFGHSFPARLLKWSKDRSETVEESVGVSDKYSIYCYADSFYIYLIIWKSLLVMDESSDAFGYCRTCAGQISIYINKRTNVNLVRECSQRWLDFQL